MTRGYWIPQIDVSDAQAYKGYMAATPPVHAKYGGRALVRGGAFELMEGRARSRQVVREFPDYAAALACYLSVEYQRARAVRLPHANIDFVISEGYDGPQPQQAVAPPAASGRKGYWIAHVDVSDPEGYQAYIAANALPFGRHGGRFLVRGGRREMVEGHVRARTVVIEFASYESALACYRSPEYQAAAMLRQGKAEVDLVVAEGCEGGQ